MPPMANTPSKRGAGRGTGRGGKSTPGKGPRGGKGPRDGQRSGGRQGSAAAPGWMPDTAAAAKPGGQAKAGGRARQGGGFEDPHARREPERYEGPIATREASPGVIAAAAGPLPAPRLAERLGLAEPDRAGARGRRPGGTVRDGELLQHRRGGYEAAAQLDL